MHHSFSIGTGDTAKVETPKGSARRALRTRGALRARTPLGRRVAKYEQCTEYGTEYFRGDETEMMCDMCAVVKRLSAVVVDGECKAQIMEK